jgi:hypothetical protein
LKQKFGYFRRRILLIPVWVAVLAAAFFATQSPKPVLAANPTTINFQGKVTNPNGTNVSDGTYSFVFRLYQNVNINTYNPNSLSCSADTNCWWEESDSLSVTNGVFQVQLGLVCAFTVACNSSHSGIDFNAENALSLTMKFNSDAAGYMAPLVSLQSVPYAYTASNALHVDSTATSPTLGIGDVNATAITLGNVTNSTFLFQAKSTATAYQFQNASNKNLLSIDTSNNELLVGTAGASGVDAEIVFNNGTNTNTVTLQTGTTSSSYSLTLPTAGPAVSQCLQNDGSTPGVLVFAACSAGGVTTVGTFSGSSQTNGASITGSTITFGPADTTNPGLVTASGSQTFGGAKTFTGNLTATGNALFEDASNSSTAFQIQNSNAVSIANVSTISTNQNLLTNPSFESNTAGWAALNGSTLSTVSSPTQSGTQSLRAVLVAGNASDGVKHTYNFKPLTTYSLSVYAAITSGATATFEMGTVQNGGGQTNCGVTAVTLTGSLTRYTCTGFTTGATTTGSDYFYFKRTTAAAGTLVFDAAQLEQSGSATAFVDQNYPNLVSNPSIESNTDGYVLRSGTTPVANSIAVSNNFSYFGNQSLLLVTGTSAAAGNGVQYNYNFQPSSRYSLSFWARRDTGAAITALQVGEQDGAGGGDTACTTNPVIGTVGITTTWTQFSCTFTTGATIGSSSAPNFYLKQTDTATSRYIYIDGVSLAAGGTAQSFIQPAASLQADPLYGNLSLNNSNIGELQPWVTNANALPQILGYHTSIVANGYVYVIGGYNNVAYQSTVYYSKLNADGSTGAWQTNANALPQILGYHTSIVANGYVYVIGGFNGATFLSTVYYAKLNADGSTGAWQTNANALPQILEYHTSIVANGYVYVIGGFNGSTFQSTVYYAKLNADGSTGAWQTNANALPQILGAQSSIVVNGYVYVIGGDNSGGVQSTVYYAKLNADGSTGAWQTNANALPQILYESSSIVANGYVYVIGGDNGSTFQSTVYYAKLNADGSTGAWQTNANALPQTLYIHTSVVANGYVYVIGGFNSATYQSTVYYASTSRILVGGSLDLVGNSGQGLSGAGGTGGSLTAANITGVGDLQIQGQANFANGVGINGNLSVAGNFALQTTTNSSTAFQVQNSSGAQLINVDTTNPTTDLTNNATNNLVTNGSFEANSTGWAAKVAGTITRVTSQQFIGNGSLKDVSTAATDVGASYAISLSDSTAYSLRFDARLDPSSAAFATLAAGYSSTGLVGGDTNCTLSSSTAVASGWTQYTCIFTTAASHSGTPYIYVKQTDAAIHTFYIDGVQLTRFSLLSNASVELALTPSDWVKKGNVADAVTQDATQHQDGSDSLKIVTTANAADGTEHNITLNDSTFYTLNFYAINTGAAFATMEAGYSSDGSTDNTTCITAQTVTGSFTQFSCSFVTPSSHSGTPYIYIKQTNGVVHTFFVDIVQLAIGNPVSAYREGQISLNGVINSPVVLQNQSNSTTAFQIQDASGINVLTLDSVSHTLKVYDSTGTHYAQIYYSGSSAFFGADSGTAVLGSGTGAVNITPSSGFGFTITGNAASTLSTSAGDLTVQAGSGNISVGTTTTITSTGAVTLQGGTTASLLSTTSDSVTVDSGTTGNVIIGATNNTNGKTVTVGNNNSGSFVNIDAGTGALGIVIGNTNTAHGIEIGSNAGAANAILLGGANSASSLTLEAGTAASGIQIGNGTTAHGIQIGAGGAAAGNAQTVVIGSDSTTAASEVTLQGGNGVTSGTFVGINIGGSTADANQILFQLHTANNNYGTGVDVSGGCSATLNQGAMYYSSVSDSIHACIGGSWEDVVSTAALGLQLFGVVPDTGVGVGDLAGANGLTNGPCKVWEGTSTSSISWNACTAYSGGRKVIVAAGANVATTAGTSAAIIWQHLCLTATNNQPALSAIGTQTANLATVSMTAASNPILCLADVKVTNGSAVITGIYNTATYTTTTKEFATNITNAAALGYIVVQGTTTPGSVAPGTVLQSGGIVGVVVASNASTTTTSISVVIAIGGPAWVKAITETGNLVGNTLQATGTIGYAGSFSGPVATNVYSVLGLARTAWTSACAISSLGCNSAVLTNVAPR